jgi:hypothetical protein
VRVLRTATHRLLVSLEWKRLALVRGGFAMISESASCEEEGLTRSSCRAVINL